MKKTLCDYCGRELSEPLTIRWRYADYEKGRLDLCNWECAKARLNMISPLTSADGRVWHDHMPHGKKTKKAEARKRKHDG